MQHFLYVINYKPGKRAGFYGYIWHIYFRNRT